MKTNFSKVAAAVLLLGMCLFAVACKSGSEQLVVSLNGEACIGDCQCARSLTLCTDRCFDLQADTGNCGLCGLACAGNQTCEAGVCGCSTGLSLCGETCLDLASDANNCGVCGTRCEGGRVCSASACACPEGKAECTDGCFDLQTDNANCGMCGNACGGGQVCSAGSCQCPEGREFCSGACVDVLANDANCGSCGNACGFGQGCAQGSCQSGALGEDGCQGLAQEIDITKISAYQTLEVPIAQAGASVADRVSEVVAGRNTLVRVFVTPGMGWSARELSARLFLENGEDLATLYSESTLNVAAASTADDRETTFEFKVPGESITPDTRFAVEVVECAEGSGTARSPRFPEEGGVELGAIDTGGLRIRIIPLRANGRVPNTAAADLELYRRAFLATYPIASIELTVGEPVDIADPTAWSQNLDSLRALRQNQQPEADVYYYGMLRSTETFREFCGGACTSGIGFLPGQRLNAQARVAMGVAYNDNTSAFTMLHEVGHNHNRQHAPCVPNGASIADVDPNYPHDAGAIGVQGYSSIADALIGANAASDVMGYCNNRWFSEYTYNGILSTVLAVNQAAASEYVAPERIGSWRVALLDSTRAPVWGHPIPGPAAAVGDEELAEVLDANGVVIERVSVYRTLISDLDASSVQVPEPKPGWHAIAIQGAAPLVYGVR
jgi:hypothetical protein